MKTPCLQHTHIYTICTESWNKFPGTVKRWRSSWNSQAMCRIITFCICALNAFGCSAAFVMSMSSMATECSAWRQYRMNCTGSLQELVSEILSTPCPSEWIAKPLSAGGSTSWGVKRRVFQDKDGSLHCRISDEVLFRNPLLQAVFGWPPFDNRTGRIWNGLPTSDNRTGRTWIGWPPSDNRRGRIWMANFRLQNRPYLNGHLLIIEEAVFWWPTFDNRTGLRGFSPFDNRTGRILMATFW